MFISAVAGTAPGRARSASWLDRLQYRVGAGWTTLATYLDEEEVPVRGCETTTNKWVILEKEITASEDSFVSLVSRLDEEPEMDRLVNYNRGFTELLLDLQQDIDLPAGVASLDQGLISSSVRDGRETH